MRDIKFISYDGKYPNLCSGELVYSADGIHHSMKWGLCSGGSVWFDDDWNENIESGEWSLNSLNFPDLSKEELAVLCDLVNANVPEGCCGGCV